MGGDAAFYLNNSLLKRQPNKTLQGLRHPCFAKGRIILSANIGTLMVKSFQREEDTVGEREVKTAIGANKS